jgi:hypothetical protein
MSSDKRRLKLRMQRLQETFQILGKDPNAKGKVYDPYDIKNMRSSHWRWTSTE